MFFISLRFSNMLLKIGIAAVFMWFGIHKFISPEYWVNAWIPVWLPGFLEYFSLTPINFIYISGIFQILVGLSFLTNVGTRIFALLASVFLLLVIIIFGFNGFNEIIVRDIGLLGGLLAIMFWPERYDNL